MFPCVNLGNGPWEYVFPNITHQKQLKYKIMASIKKFTVSPYNMRGFNTSKINYVTDLLGRYDILLLQEHWLINKNCLLLIVISQVIVYIGYLHWIALNFCLDVQMAVY